MVDCLLKYFIKTDVFILYHVHYCGRILRTLKVSKHNFKNIEEGIILTQSKDKTMNTKPKNQDSINNYKQFSDFELEYLLNHSITYSDYKNRRRLGWSRERKQYLFQKE